MSTARDYWVKPFETDHPVPCVASLNCGKPSKFRIGWRFDKTVNGVPTPMIASRSACHLHARIFADKKGIEFPRVTA